MKTCTTKRIPGSTALHAREMAGLLALLLILSACGFMGEKRAGIQTPLPPLKRIAILPMDRVSTRPASERPTCTLNDVIISSQAISPQTAREVTSLLFHEFRGDPRFVLVPEGTCMGFLNAMLATDIKASQLKLIRSFGRQLGVDAVLYGKLYRFRDRIGSPYSAKRPASVALSLHLIRVSDGAVLWSYTFDETQHSLTENLFQFRLYRKQGMRWLTAKELTRYALDQAAKDLKKRLSPE